MNTSSKPRIREDGVDLSEIDGNMPWSEGADAPYLVDPYAAGAACVTKKGLPLEAVTPEERCRFRIAFMRTFMALSPETIAELLMVRNDIEVHAPHAKCGAETP